MNGPPNILLFLTDQQRVEGVGVYGLSPVQTPHVDRLAARGQRFTNAYCAGPLCSPSRASILTGLYPHAHGVTSNIHEMGSIVNEIPDSPHLVSRQLEAAGYRTGYMGKWHIGSDFGNRHRVARWWNLPNEPALPSNRGFAAGIDFPGHGDGGHGYPQYERYLAENGWSHRVRPHATDGEKITGYGILEGPAEATVSHFLANQTLAMMDEAIDAQQPFFLWHNDWGPHGAHLVPEAYLDRYREVEVPPWPSFDWELPPGHPAWVKRVPNAEQFGWAAWAEVVRHYYAWCSLIDDQLGRMLAHLEARDALDNTLIVFASDHGETLGSHGGLTDKGFSHFEEIQRVPLIISGTDRVQPRVRDELVSLVDLYPTFCDFADQDWDRPRIQGRSLRPLLERSDTADGWRDTLFVEFFGLGSVATNMVTCRYASLKYGWTATGTDELYDLHDDPHELHNLIDDPRYARALQDLRRRMYTFMIETDYPAADTFVRTRLDYNVDRQFRGLQDPVDPSHHLMPLAY
jgi:arylsulfatase A-like enzyme